MTAFPRRNVVFTHVVFTLVLAVLLAGCAPRTTERPSLREVVSEAQRVGQEATEDSDRGHDHGGHDHGTEDPEPAPSPTGEDTGQDGPGTDGSPTDTPSPTSTATAAPEPREPEPEGPVMEQHSDFPITATLSPTCVERGGAITLTVDTGRKHTGVVYLAYYAGGENGAPPPYGDDHGGNHGDLTDDDGQFEDTWVVSPEAPVGPARVEVKAGRDGMRSTAVVRFEVVEAGTGGCKT